MIAARPELEELLARYALGIDNADFDGVLDCFAADAIFEVIDSYVAHGKDEIARRIHSRHHDGCTHLTCNSLFEQAGQGVVRGRASFAVLDPHASVISCGEYEDRMILGPNGRWLFISRRIRYRGRPGSLGTAPDGGS
jgi:hypothetical protein